MGVVIRDSTLIHKIKVQIQFAFVCTIDKGSRYLFKGRNGFFYIYFNKKNDWVRMHIINTLINPEFDSKAPVFLVWMTSDVAVQVLWLRINTNKKLNVTMLVPTSLQIISIFIIQ